MSGTLHSNLGKTILSLVAVMLMFFSSSVIDVSANSSLALPGPINQSWVNQELVNWQPTTIAPIGFGAVLQTASYANIYENSISVINSDLAMLVSSGVRSVRIDVDFDPWLQNNAQMIAKMNTVVQLIRGDGLKLIIADASAESYRDGGQVTWTKFQSAWVQRVQTLASAYHPDYYIVIKEPAWYLPMISDSSSNPQVQNSSSWLNLTRQLTSAAHAVSPQTLVGISVGADGVGTKPSFYYPYLSGVESQTGVTFLGFDIYDSFGFKSTQNFLGRIGNGGKSVWIAEAWSSGNISTAFNPANSQLDAGWIKVLYYFAESQVHAQMIVPFYTNNFAQYNSENSVPSSSFFASRQPVFYSYQSLITTSKQ